MVITIDDGTPQTLINGPTRTSGEIAGPVGDFSMDAVWNAQWKEPIRATNATPLDRDVCKVTFDLTGIYYSTTEDLAREWAAAWPATVKREGTLYITGASKRTKCVNTVIYRVAIKQNGLIAIVTYFVMCGAVTVENNPT